MKQKRQTYYNQERPQRKPLINQSQQNKTSWGKVSDWYDNYLQDEDNYQNKVIFPNLFRLLNIKENNLSILDLGCGQGFFIDKIINDSKYKIDFFGVDVSTELLNIAKKNITNDDVVFYNTDASDLSNIKSDTIDIIYSVLALQNMKDLDKVISESSRVLKKDGKCFFVINHPSFRIPKESDWYFDNTFKRQGRVVYNYMSDKKYIIDMHPGQKETLGKEQQTISFHHPLQYFSKIFDKNNLAIKRIEEWISHKKSEKGIKKEAEDNARKEIPMFMCLELINIAK